MVNAPLCRPPTRPERHRPKGPRTMPLSRNDQERVNRLRQASQHLRTTGAPELADEVDFVLTAEGANFAKRIQWQEAEQENPNLALRMPREMRDRIKLNASRSGQTATLATQAVIGLNKFLNGEFMPPRPQRAPRGTAAEAANLNVRVNAELRQQVDEHGKKLLADGVTDWAPITSQVLIAWFVENFGQPLPDAGASGTE
ncbi:hypothetical protein [Streptomyces chilikensis]|uniref:Uncharacterized protein n=1 Tax=Streptomyces chilikensis TaxID=1194079 RepID=A0ABV3ERF6_9ACTN